MDILLPPGVETMIRTKLATGRYATAGDVARDALCQMQEREEDRERLIAELNAMIDEGLDQRRKGQTVPADDAFAGILAGIPAPKKRRR